MPNELNDLVRLVKSFAASRVAMAAIDLDLFRKLDSTPQSRAELKRTLNLKDGPISDAFINVLIAYDLLAETEGTIRLQPMAQSVIPCWESIKSWNREMHLFYESMCDFSAVVQSGDFSGTALANFWAYKKSADPSIMEETLADAYSEVMDDSQVQLSVAIADQVDWTQFGDVVDLGGGKGRLAITLAEKNPHLRITTVDLPAVCRSVQERVEERSLGSRVRCLPRDFFRDPLPTNAADAVLLVRVLHDWENREVDEVLQRARATLRPSGTVIVIEPMDDDHVEHSRSSVLTALMLALLGGRRRTPADYAERLESLGFGRVSKRKLGLSSYWVVQGHVA